MYLLCIRVLINSVETNANKTYIIIIITLLYLYTLCVFLLYAHTVRLYTLLFTSTVRRRCSARMAKKRQTPLSHCYPVARRHKYTYTKVYLRVGGIKSKQVPRSLSRPDRKKKEILKPLLQYIHIYTLNAYMCRVGICICICIYNPLARI